MKIYVKFEDETLEQCIKAHAYLAGYDSVEHATIDTNLSTPKGTSYQLVTEDGKVLKSAIVGE